MQKVTVSRWITEEELSAEFIHVVDGPDVGRQRRYAGDEGVDEGLGVNGPVRVAAGIGWGTVPIVLEFDDIAHRHLRGGEE